MAKAVYPACAGIDHRGGCFCRRCEQFTPHARGSTLNPSLVHLYFQVYPACAGIDLAHSAIQLPSMGLPRMRGDRPCIRPRLPGQDRFTPHARGSTPVQTLQPLG